MIDRRAFLASAAAAGTITILPFRATAQEANIFQTDTGTITVHPVGHASLVMETPNGVIAVDPVGGADLYASLPRPDLLLITHEHGDHYDVDTLTALMGENTQLIVNPGVQAMLPEVLAGRATAIANGQTANWGDVRIEAIPAHNTTEDRLQFRPPGRDNGYVLSIDGMRVYISGDTEGTPEMRALEDIDLAFVCMNLPFTMDAAAAAEAVAGFAPRYVYPYHYQGRDGGTQDPAEFAALLAEAGAETQVLYGDWY